MSKHTSGPWKILDEENLETQTDGRSEGIVGTDSDGFQTDYDICRVLREAPRDETIANTRLIAAAPDLLEALKELEDTATQAAAWIPHILLTTAIEKARLAIKKAEGRG